MEGQVGLMLSSCQGLRLNDASIVHRVEIFSMF